MKEGRQTTMAERLEIVEYCLAHDKDYQRTMAAYDVSYHQVYSWVRKYQDQGIAGLADRRGHSTIPTEARTPTDDLQAANRQLRAEKRRLEVENAVLRKMREHYDPSK